MTVPSSDKFYHVARHVFATIIGLYETYKTLEKPEKKAFHTHITMLDIHPTALARDLCLLMWFHDLLEADPNDKILVLELKATIMYTYMGVFMPPYCYSR